MHDVFEHGLVRAFVLDGQGSGRALDYADLVGLILAEHESLWLHWDRGHPRAQAWLRQDSGLGEFSCDLLLEENTRPRLVPLANDEFLLFLRGLNLNPGENLEDMVSLRIFAAANKVISLRLRSAQVTDELMARLEQGVGPRNSSELALALAMSLTERLDGVVDDLSDQLDAQEDLLSARGRQGVDQGEMVAIRRRAAGLRRFLAPQRDIYAQLARMRLPWFLAEDPDYWNELYNRLVRYLEELELIRERASMVMESERSRSTERMNRTMYRFGIVTGIFLPMSFLTGLLGINVGGIPGSESPYGFLIACAVIALVAALQLILYRRLRWF